MILNASVHGAALHNITAAALQAAFASALADSHTASDATTVVITTTETEEAVLDHEAGADLSGLADDISSRACEGAAPQHACETEVVVEPVEHPVSHLTRPHVVCLLLCLGACLHPFMRACTCLPSPPGPQLGRRRPARSAAPAA